VPTHAKVRGEILGEVRPAFMLQVASGLILPASAWRSNRRPANEAMDLSHGARGDMKRELLVFVEVPAGRRGAIIGRLGAINPPKGASECAPVFVASIVSDLIDGKSTRP
jgi:hypothetical protein